MSTQEESRKITTKEVYLTFRHSSGNSKISSTLGKVRLTLYSSLLPKTCHNFLSLIANSSYTNSIVHRIIPGFVVQGGDYTHGDGTGGESIYGGNFEDESFALKHECRGILSMANSGADSNGSQFFITLQKVPHLDGRHVVFGSVVQDDEESWAVLDSLEKLGSKSGAVKGTVRISDCGILHMEAKQETAHDDDDDEIDIEDDEEEEEEEENNPAAQQSPNKQKQEEKEEEEEEKPLSKKAALKQRLQKLKLKINQSRTIHKSEVRKEGERVGESGSTTNKYRANQKKQDRERKQKEWMSMNGKAEGDVSRMEQGIDCMKKAAAKAERAEKNRYSVKDYYNPEGQHRHYERTLKSLPSKPSSSISSTVYDPTAIQDTQQLSQNNDYDPATTGGGAKRLSNELLRRQAKGLAQKRKRQELEMDASDVSYINQKNKRFNEKIGRNYDKFTAEIRQNLERGTAL